jgi:diguanylate cyclase (GGDEF)-like protein/PAS domain S-box-containing protein
MPPHRQKILIIEDSPDFRAFLTAILNRDGIQAVAVASGAEGLAIASEQKFDLVLLDLGLPDMDGFEVCRLFKKKDNLRSIPILIITARDNTEDKVKAFELGATDYLNKSFDNAEMRARIFAALRAKHSQEVMAAAARRQRLRTEHDLLRISKAIDAASDAISITDGNGRQVYQNHSFWVLFEYTQDELQGDHAPGKLFADPQVWDTIWDFCKSGDSWRGEVEVRTHRGSIVSASCRADAILDEESKIIGSVCIFTDVTERKRLERDLVYLATHDPLTNLHNRRFFQEMLENAVLRAKRGSPSSLLYLDLDNFKIINDTLGHLAGDRLLLKMASLLKEHTREADSLARLGGDEFAVLLTNTDAVPAEIVGRKLVKLVDDLRFVEQERIYPTSVSIGITVVDGTITAEEVLARADAACFNAKANGRNRYELYRADASEIAQLDRQSSWMVVIKDALKHNRFELWLQPIIPLNPQDQRFFEVLLRLRDGKLILPSAFIPVAERFGSMMAIDRLVINNAISLLSSHPELSLSLNLSAKSLNDLELDEYIKNMLLEHEIEPGRLTFELTETAMIMNLSQARTFISKIKEMGCRFALDDFGSGFTSYSYLRDLPLDFIKIDGSFIQHIAEDPINRALVRSINEVSHILGKQTIAEYVVNAQVLEVVKELGIDYAQGWHIGEPAPPATFVQPVTRRLVPA